VRHVRPLLHVYRVLLIALKMSLCLFVGSCQVTVIDAEQAAQSASQSRGGCRPVPGGYQCADGSLWAGGYDTGPGISTGPGITAGGYSTGPGISTGPGLTAGGYNTGPGISTGPGLAASGYNSGSGIPTGPGIPATGYSSIRLGQALPQVVIILVLASLQIRIAKRARRPIQEPLRHLPHPFFIRSSSPICLIPACANSTYPGA
jgi:hypothetical protein